jgi:hypothetical protein
VEPLITARWHQGCLYNSLCPTFEDTPCGHAEVGCVAVAMAQIMHYWKFPECGFSSHAYSYLNMSLSADFGNTFYDWDNMPDSLNENSSNIEIDATAALLFHCGVSVDMKYNANGSGAQTTDVPYALTHYFKYSDELHYDQADNDIAVWLAKLKTCLDQERPILYSGRGSGAHAFVCDGYDGNDMLHFNWGWGGNGDGYFALGNLNPPGHNYNNGNIAILDIVPRYEPFQVVGTAYPLSAGNITGAGSFQMGDTCSLCAIPSENCDFLYWKKEDRIVSYDSIYTFAVEKDLVVEADFTYRPANQINAGHAPDANNTSSPFISLSWSNPNNGHWNLLKQFKANPDEKNLASDGNFIYTSSTYPNPTSFSKYTLDGEFVESFEMEGLCRISTITYDGNYFYCTGKNDYWYETQFFCIDLANKTLVETLNLNTYDEIYICSYDSFNDGFWLSTVMDHKHKLYNRNGDVIKSSPTTSYYVTGSGFHLAKDGNPHLLLIEATGQIYDYDITNDIIHNRPLLSLNGNPHGGSFFGKYDGKNALFVSINDTTYIYEINSNLSQITHYRIYRTDDQENMITLAEEVSSAHYIDSTWKDAANGTYRYGVSSVFANGNESEIVWSDTIVKKDHGITENTSPIDQAIQKIFENGQIIIIKDEKKYNINGQEIQ